MCQQPEYIRPVADLLVYSAWRPLPPQLTPRQLVEIKTSLPTVTFSIKKRILFFQYYENMYYSLELNSNGKL